LESYEKFGHGKWIIENLDGTPMGHSGLIYTWFDGIEDVELGYFLHPKFWHQGFATEAASLGLSLALNKFEFKRVVSAINPANFPSIKVAIRLGMRKEKNCTARVGADSWNCDLYALHKNSESV
jgi:RimJ/RimL family protein N-acetyltransferase